MTHTEPESPKGMVSFTTATAMAETYNSAVKRITEAYAELVHIEAALSAASLPGGLLPGRNYTDVTEATEEHLKQVLQHLHRSAWARIVEKTRIRQVMSSKKVAQLDKWLKNETQYNHTTRKQEYIDPLPPITAETICGMCTHFAENLDEFVSDAVAEVYNWLRPHDHEKYKRNSAYEVPAKIIREYAVECWGKGFHLNHYRQQDFRNLDNVFSLLDGKGPIKSYGGPLADAIHESGFTGKGETDYFRFKCYKNHNIHIEFKRLDLLAKLNQIAGGNMLRHDESKESA